MTIVGVFRFCEKRLLHGRMEGNRRQWEKRDANYKFAAKTCVPEYNHYQRDVVVFGSGACSRIIKSHPKMCVLCTMYTHTRYREKMTKEKEKVKKRRHGKKLEKSHLY